MLQLVIEYVDNKISHKEMMDNVNLDYLGLLDDYSEEIGNVKG